MIWAAVFLGAVLGGLIQSITGFGAAVVMMTVLPYFFTMIAGPSISTSICFGLTITLAWKFRRHIKLSIMLLPTVFYGIMSIAAIRLLGGMDLRVLTILFGAFLMLLGTYFLTIAKNTKVRFTLPMTIAFSVLAGVTGGLFSIGGPIMAVYFLEVTDGREEYLGNMQSHFFINNVINMCARIVSGYYTLSLLPFTLLGIAGVVCGQKAGLKVGGRLNADRLRTVVYGYVVLSGAITVAQQLLK